MAKVNPANYRRQPIDESLLKLVPDVILCTHDHMDHYDEETELPGDIDAVFLSVNGVGNNMNMKDAAAFAEKCGARVAIPFHVGLFDDLSGKDFPFEPKIVPEIYHEIKL